LCIINIQSSAQDRYNTDSLKVPFVFIITAPRQTTYAINAYLVSTADQNEWLDDGGGGVTTALAK
jgi:hypothetical protein